MDDDWLNDEELVAALAVHEHEQQETQEDNVVPGTEEPCEGFDMATGNSWIYPKNLPLRSYQHSIVHSALYKNTLVVLPTGLGKTFIAAVVMYNFYRWYPQGKIVFMAPTRPLVAQQINASQKIMPFAAADTVQLTGQLARPKRAELWATKRVFFATPQVVHSDMLEADGTSTFPFNSIKLVVVDEAHRAKGRYAYTQVADCLMAHNRNFRMLALSATPGRTMEDVASVCQNLYICSLQVRWDNSIDVQPYVHRRTIRTIVVSLKDRIKEPREKLLQIIEPYLRQLIEADILRGSKGGMSKNNLLYEQKVFAERSSAQGQRHPDHNIIMGNFAMCISMYHSLELMERHGLRVFVNSFDADEDGREKFVLARDRALRDLVEQVRQELGANPLDYSTGAMTNGEVAALPADLDYGHAKYEQLRQVLIKHFAANPDSRAIVFCEYRESVMLIHRLLLQHRPQLRPRCFVGQGHTVGSSYALTQKQQLQIMADFRSGTSNVLVATSIGEEGIDVGEVEMIVCFDICSSNPTRFVQRIGRTGRKKNGEVVMLVTEGREQQVLKDVLAHKDQMNKKLLNSSVVKMSLYEHNPRMVPSQFQPKCEEKHMEQAPVEEKPIGSKAKAAAKAKEPRKRKEPIAKACTIKRFFKEVSVSESQLGISQGMQPYQMSEASQRMVKQEVFRRSVPLNGFLADTQAAKPTLSNSQEDVQRLRKLTRFLQSNKPVLADSQTDLICHLQDQQLPRPLKLYLLQSNPLFLRETHSKMQLQSQLEIPDDRLNNRQQKTRNNYKLLVDICGGSDHLEEFLQAEQQSLAEITFKELENPLDERREREFKATCDTIFEGLDEQGLNADNYDLKQELLEKLDVRNLEVTVNEQLRGIPETSWSEEEWEEQPAEDVKCDSMYLSQQLNLSAADAVQHSSTPLRVKPLSKLMFEPMPEEQEDENTDLGNNLGRLNCLMNASESLLKTEPVEISVSEPETAGEENPPAAASEVYPLSSGESGESLVPSVEPKVKSELDDLEIDLDDFLEPMDEEIKLTQLKKEAEVLSQEELKDFLEPMAEELELMGQNNAPQSSSTEAKEKEPLLISPSKSISRNVSPDIFASDSLSPWKPAGKSLATKLAAKAAAAKAPTPPSNLQSPESREKTNPLTQEKSPSIFDLYLNRMRGRGRLAKAAESLHRLTSANASVKEEEKEDSPIVRRPSKRKIVISSDDEDEQKKPLVADYDSDDYEQIPCTQMEPETPTPPPKPRQKRAKFNSFIVDEADKSGSDHDEEAETTIGTYLKDSVIVSSDDDEDPNDTNVHAMYLQAVRSPIQRPGAFKMPAPKVYRDESHIFSQPVEAEASQYLPCSFIVDDDSSTIQDVSECPLEKAERILKERRRQRRLGNLQPVAPANKRRRIQTMSTSSDEDDVCFVK
ncbi:DEAD-box ATP-dependent DNA helicase Fancm [Drosophila kikkawai]|uniref:DEAD-box ATP-dependent DNA helicase Fancm n=1 Tax=Drosophila kikkawai TaxID=30033 RepID=A0A6P4J4Y1_DROKI|nr:uncharacterized protein LOC108084287 [Drosophila kikkawai]